MNERGKKCGRRNLNLKFRLHRVAKEAFNLSDGEEKFIVNARIGQGILVSPEGRLPFYNMLSDEERRLFTTRPKEIMA